MGHNVVTYIKPLQYTIYNCSGDFNILMNWIFIASYAFKSTYTLSKGHILGAAFARLNTNHSSLKNKFYNWENPCY